MKKVTIKKKGPIKGTKASSKLPNSIAQPGSKEKKKPHGNRSPQPNYRADVNKEGTAGGPVETGAQSQSSYRRGGNDF